MHVFTILFFSFILILKFSNNFNPDSFYRITLGSLSFFLPSLLLIIIFRDNKLIQLIINSGYFRNNFNYYLHNNFRKNLLVKFFTVVILVTFLNYSFFMLIYDQPDDLNDDLIDPIWEYRHNEDGFGSITGGYVYRGEEAPSLYGKYIFTDYMFGEIWALDIENKSVESIYNTSSQGPQPIRIPGFGITSSNELYFADRTSGSIYKFKENIYKNKIIT